MKKKVFATLLAVSMIASMVPAAVSVQAADGDSIRLVNGKIEVDAQLKKLAEMYEKETGTKVEIESMGGGIDIQGTLKGYYQSDNMPDIFVNGGATDFANWTDLLVDMSDQEWASDTDAAYVDEKQGTIGFNKLLFISFLSSSLFSYILTIGIVLCLFYIICGTVSFVRIKK